MTQVANLQEAFQALQQGRLDVAEMKCRAVLQQASKNADALHILALTLSKAGKIAEAEKYFASAEKHHPLKHEVLNNHANMLRRLKRSQEAVSCLNKAVKLKPEFVEGWHSLGLCYADLKEEDNALEAYKKALALKPDHLNVKVNLSSLYLRIGQAAEAKSLLDGVITKTQKSPVAYNNRASARTELHDLEGAVHDYELAAQLAPNNSEIMANLARAYQRVGQIDLAEKAYGQSISLVPSNHDAHDDYNRMLWEEGKEQTFLQSLDWAIGRVSPSQQSDLLLLKAKLCRLTGHLEKALDAATHASQMTNGGALATAELAVLLDHAGDEKAGAHHERAFRAAPENYDVRHQYAEYLLARDEFVAAEEVLGEVAPADHLQKHIALTALCHRGLGKEEYRKWYNYELFTKKIEIVLPERYSSHASFLSAVEEELEPLFAAGRAPADQTLFNGAQSRGHLWHHQTPALRDLRLSLLKTAANFIENLPDDDSHPFLARKPKGGNLIDRLQYNAAWAVKLQDGGGHVDHIHPAGWISAAHYVKMPQSILDSTEAGNSREGWLRLGCSGVRGLEMPAEEYVKPEPGCIIIFPSYLWHGVEAFNSNETRITTPFDLLPA